VYTTQNTFQHRIRGSRIELETPSAAVAVVSLIGEHDLAEYESLKKTLDLAASRRRHVIVDLSDCAFVCSTVVSLLLHVQGEVVSDGGRFGVVIPPDCGAVSRVAELMGFESLFPVHASLETARSSLRPSSGALVPAGPDFFRGRSQFGAGSALSSSSRSRPARRARRSCVEFRARGFRLHPLIMGIEGKKQLSTTPSDLASLSYRV